MTRPRLLDLFCGAGGAAMGYYRAGFDVVGVDINPQPRYPFEFIEADAMTFPLDGFDAVHASPPCQTFTRAKHLRKAQGGVTAALDLVDPTRRRLRQSGLPYVIENVPGAPLYGVQLCGSMFGLAVQRHRVFESNVYIPPLTCDHSKFPIDPKSGKPRPIGVYHVLADEVPQGGKTAETLEQARAAMGIDWMLWDELKESVPPTFTEYIGSFVLPVAVEAAA